jgi:chromate transporter
MSIQAFGGVLPLAERAIVTDRRWLTKKEFVEMLAISQAIPGPNIVNLSLMLGDRFQGWRGALASAAGCLLMPILLVSCLTLVFQAISDHPTTKGALLGMGSASIGLVAAMGVRLLSTQKDFKFGWVVLSGTVLAVGFGGLSLPLTILMFGVPAVLIRLWQTRGLKVVIPSSPPTPPPLEIVSIENQDSEIVTKSRE